MVVAASEARQRSQDSASLAASAPAPPVEDLPGHEQTVVLHGFTGTLEDCDCCCSGSCVGESCLKVRLLVDAELQRGLLRGPIQRGRASMAEIGLSAEGAGTALSRSLGQKRGAGAERSIRTS